MSTGLSSERNVNAREESFTKALSIALCPQLKTKSFTFGIVVIDFIIFIISLSLNPMSNTEFLAPNSISLDTLGEKDNAKIKNHFQVWRWITPILLHANFMHIFMNSLGTVIMGSGIEAYLGFKQMFVLYFVSGFGGNVFSSVTNGISHSVGASTAIFGLLGYNITFLWMVWNRISSEIRMTILIYLVLMLLLNAQQATPVTDTMGHLGGLMTGAIMGLILVNDDNKAYKKYGYGALMVFFGVMLSVFFTMIKV